MHPGFFQTFWHWLQQQLNAYIAANTARVAQSIEPAVITLGVLYVMGWGYLQLTGRIEEPVTTGLQRIIRLAIVLGISLHLWLYNDLIVDTFYRAPAQLASAIVGSGDPVATIDAIWAQGGGVAQHLLKNGLHFWNYLTGAATYVVVGFLCVYVMFLIALASVASAVLLAVGPLFMALLLFDTTRRFFEAWIAQLANYALITILTVLVAALLLGVMQSYASQTAERGASLTAVDVLDMLLLAALTLLLMRQVLPIAAALAGGFALSSLNAVSRTVGAPVPTAQEMRSVALGLLRRKDGKLDGGTAGGQSSSVATTQGTKTMNAVDLPAR
jgi:type IV secretion system protein VirB6